MTANVFGLGQRDYGREADQRRYQIVAIHVTVIGKRRVGISRDPAGATGRSA